MENRKNRRVLAVLALIAAIAIAFAGIGYAYTATTVSQSNSVASENILVKLYADDGLLTEKYDYSDDVAKVKYNDYLKGFNADNEKDIVYGVAEDASILSISSIVLQSEGLADSTNPTGEKQVAKLTMILSKDILAAGTTYSADDFEVKLTLTDGGTQKVWEGVNDGRSWVFTKSEADTGDGDYLKATADGVAYSLSFVLKADPEMDISVLGTADEESAIEECYPHDRKLDAVIGTEPMKIHFVAESLEA